MLGVDPDAQGLRLGRALTDLGPGAPARAAGRGEVLLYVEEDNTARRPALRGPRVHPLVGRRRVAAEPGSGT